MAKDMFYILTGVQEDKVIGTLLLPEPIGMDKIVAAWSYAIRYGADGYDKHNYEKSIKLLLERHPTWKFYPGRGMSITYKSHMADNDPIE